MNWLRKIFKRKPHVHTGYRWDNYYEHCRCGACAGDRRDKHGLRCITFDEWPSKERVVQR